MKRLFLSLLLVLLFAFPSSVLADVAPPYFPPGSNPLPETENTQVRMAAETVVVDVQKDITPGSLGKAIVTADFRMENLGGADESMAVRFPISAQSGRGDYPEIVNIVIKVNGKRVAFRKANYPDAKYGSENLPWAEFDITFPAGKVTAIQVSYTLQGTGYPPYTAFYYILETGAGWKGTIGSADIILRLPYPANNQNVVMDYQIGWATSTPGVTFEGNEARWHFEDFEPGPDNAVQNMEFGLVSPAAWNQVLTARENARQYPNDGERWGQLAKSYKQIFLMNKGYREDAGGEELYQLSIDAYEKCLALKPEDAQWHAGFADLLINRLYWDAWGKGPSADSYRGLEEIHTALKLAPNDPKVQEIATNIHYMFPDGMTQTTGGFDFPWLTQTPTAIPPTATIVPAFDAAVISGVYQSDTIIFSNAKKAVLVFTLNPGHWAGLETRYENEAAVILPGAWVDNGDGTLKLSMVDPIRGQIEFVFKVMGERLQAVSYPGTYGEAGIFLGKPASATPEPAATIMPQAAPSSTPEPATAAPTQSPRSSAPICGSAALVPLALMVWGIRGRVKPRRGR